MRHRDQLVAGALTLAAIGLCLAIAPVALLWVSPAVAMLLFFAVGLTDPALDYVERLQRRFERRPRRASSALLPRLDLVLAALVRLSVPSISARPPPAFGLLYR